MPASSKTSSNTCGGRCAPIGVFDSGYGGMTVLHEIAQRMPHESVIFIGDSAHFPYGPKRLEDVRGFVVDICSYLVERGCKIIVIACNTATAAGLKEAQRLFDVPIVGVVEPGSRAAVHMTRSRKVGVIATQGTVDSGAYADAIHNLDAGIDVFSAATPKLVDIAEQGLQFINHPHNDNASGDEGGALIVSDRGVLDCDSGEVYRVIAEEYIRPLCEQQIDTLVLGCTHFPLIQNLIQNVAGSDVALVSSAEETAREVEEILNRRNELYAEGNGAYEFFTTGENVADFQRFGSFVMGFELAEVKHLGLWD